MAGVGVTVPFHSLWD